MDEFIGVVKLFEGNFAPQGRAFCDGALSSINQNQALFALLDNQLGGDGRSTFVLPNPQPLISANEAPVKYIIRLSGVFPLRA